MHLRQLHYFVALAEELHFGRAAQRSFVTQQSLSGAIRRLEGRVGVRLFERDRHGVSLTPAGETFLEDVRPLLAQAERAVQRARAAGADERRLSVGFVPPAINLLPEALRTFEAQFPDVNVVLTELCSDDQRAGLLANRLHVVIMHAFDLQAPWQDLHLEPLLNERVLVALPTGHSLTIQPVVALRDLADVPMVLFAREEAPALHKGLLELCHAAGFEPHIVQEVSPQTAQLRLVAQQVGVALVTEGVRDAAPRGVELRALKDVLFTMPLTAAWRSGNALAGAFGQTLRDAASAWNARMQVDHALELNT